MKCVPVHHGIPAILHRDEPWLHRHSENGALSVFYELLKKTPFFINFFSLCMIFGMHLDNVSVLLNSVAAAYVHLATSSVTC